MSSQTERRRAIGAPLQDGGIAVGTWFSRGGGGGGGGRGSGVGCVVSGVGCVMSGDDVRLHCVGIRGRRSRFAAAAAVVAVVLLCLATSTAATTAGVCAKAYPLAAV